MGSNYPQYSHADGAPHVANIAHFNNSQNMVWGNDREIMTTDSGPPSGVYWGHVKPQSTSAGAALQVELAARSAGSCPFCAVCVIAGAGTGECRRVVNSGTPATNYTVGWTVAAPFTTPLDAGSRITILPYTGQIAINGNNFADGGAIQFYGFAESQQAIGNVFDRTVRAPSRLASSLRLFLNKLGAFCGPGFTTVGSILQTYCTVSWHGFSPPQIKDSRACADHSSGSNRVVLWRGRG